MARSGRSWVVAAVVLGGALAACGGQNSHPTVLPPVVSTTRPSGFGGTLPVETTSTLAPTTAPAVVTAAKTTVAASTTDEAALRARVLEYDRAFREELLHMPNPNYDRLRSFYEVAVRTEISFEGIRKEAEAQRSYRLNTPDVYRPVIERLDIRSKPALAVLCAEDNIVAFGPGPDGVPRSLDDEIVGASLSSTRHTEEWIVQGSTWLIQRTISYEDLGKGAQCLA